MSQKCPQCRLFNPPEALRCDCGYDFKAQRVLSSYLVDDEIRKHGGMTNFLGSQARGNLVNGSLLLGFVVVLSAMTYIAGGRSLVLGWPAVSGALLVYRGMRQRRMRQALVDRETRAPKA